jgi:hypothetical protein
LGTTLRGAWGRSSPAAPNPGIFPRPLRKPCEHGGDVRNIQRGVMTCAYTVKEDIGAQSSGDRMPAKFVLVSASGVRKAVDSGVHRDRLQWGTCNGLKSVLYYLLGSLHLWFRPIFPNCPWGRRNFGAGSLPRPQWHFSLSTILRPIGSKWTDGKFLCLSEPKSRVLSERPAERDHDILHS